MRVASIITSTLLHVASAASALDTNGPRRAQSIVTRQNCDIPPLKQWEHLAAEEGRTLCYLEPDKHGEDDGPAISSALNDKCRCNSIVVLPADSYNIKTFLDTTKLDNVRLHIFGRLLWSKDIDFWLNVSKPVGFQNQSTVWYFGGDNVVWDGHGTGTLDGNGQVWYNWAHGRGNLPHRPMMINWKGFNNSIVRRQRFVQTQMWTMATTWSNNLLFEDIYVNNTSNNGNSTLNTDGVDTIFSNNITFNRWNVTCGDDHIALKRNSTNISVYDSVFYGGQGFAIGSMAQYNGEVDVIEHFYARNITMYGTRYVMYLKTWPGIQNGYPPNGGGGGLGRARDIVVENVRIEQGRSSPLSCWQCEHYEGAMGKDCDSSKFKMSDIVWRNIRGTVQDSVTHGGSLQCSLGAGGCNNITVQNYGIKHQQGSEVMDTFKCSNIYDYKGFDCVPFPKDESDAGDD